MTPTLSTMTWYDTTYPADPIRAVVTAAIGDLTWTTTNPTENDPGSGAADAELLMPAAALHLAAAQYPLEVARVAAAELPASGTADGRGPVGIEVADPAGRTRIYAVHDDTECVVVAAEYTPTP